jgi:hypothetical protein
MVSDLRADGGSELGAVFAVLWPGSLGIKYCIIIRKRR